MPLITSIKDLFVDVFEKEKGKKNTRIFLAFSTNISDFTGIK